VGGVGRALYPSLFFLLAASAAYERSLVLLAGMGIIGSIIVSVGLGQRQRIQTGDSVASGTLGALRTRITIPLVTLTVIAFVSAFATQGVAAWIPTYLAQQKSLGISSSLGLTLTGMYGASIAGQPLFGFLIDRFQKRLILAVSIVGSALSIIGYLFATGILDTALLALVGLFTFSGFPVFLSVAYDYVPKGASSLSNALVWSLGYNGGSVVGPAVVGAVALSGYASWTSAFELMAAGALLAAAMIGLLRSPQKNSKMPLLS